MQAARYVEYDHSFSDEEIIKAYTLKISCNLNNAACKFKLGDYVGVSRFCTKGFLSLSPSHTLSIKLPWLLQL